jgi:hypothetical protein
MTGEFRIRSKADYDQMLDMVYTQCQQGTLYELPPRLSEVSLVMLARKLGLPNITSETPSAIIKSKLMLYSRSRMLLSQQIPLVSPEVIDVYARQTFPELKITFTGMLCLVGIINRLVGEWRKYVPPDGVNNIEKPFQDLAQAQGLDLNSSLYEALSFFLVIPRSGEEAKSSQPFYSEPLEHDSIVRVLQVLQILSLEIIEKAARQTSAGPEINADHISQAILSDPELRLLCGSD